MENNIKKTILIEAKECIEMGKISKGEVLLKGYLDFNNCKCQYQNVQKREY